MKTKHFAIFLIALALVTVFASCNTDDTTTKGEETSSSTGETTTETTVVTTTVAIQTTDKNFTTVATTTAATTTKATTKPTSTMATTTIATTTAATTKATTHEVKTIELNVSNITLNAGNTYTLRAVVSVLMTDKSVTWSSSDASVASVSKGVVTAKAKGDAIITVTASDGSTATCTVKVITPTIDISCKKLGMLPVKVSSKNNLIATVEIPKDYLGIRIKSVNTGKTTVTLYDDFGNSMTVSVSVDSDKNVICSEITRFSKDKTLNVVCDFKAIPNDGFADTTEIQKAINSLAESGGGTVYIPRGFYNVALLLMKENVNLELAGKVEDATVGYTNKIKARVEGGEFAVLRTLGGDMFRNVVAGSHGLTGIDNFHINGGVFDMNGSSRCILFVCADNASMTNCIIKDCLNDHAIQVTGSTNITLKNIMFAGYKTGSNLKTGEEVQIEAGCNGATGGNIAVFGDAEYYFSKNVLIDHCYFGPSDKYGSQTIAIGHHGYRNKSDANGLTISNCVFKNNSIYSIKTASYSNTKIINNTFISEGDNRVTNSSVPDTYNKETFIFITLANNDVKGYPTSSSSQAFLAKKQSCEGSQNIEISGNTFTMSGDAVSRRVIVANSNNYTVGAETVVDMLKYIEYGTPAKYYTGYIPVQNVIYNLVVKNNEININCKSAGSVFNNYFLRFSRVVGLTLEGNQINKAGGVSFTSSYNSTNGVSVSNCIIGKEMYTRTIKMRAFDDASIGVILSLPDKKTSKITATGTPTLTLKSDGNGEIVLVYGDNGSVTATLVPKEGYRFVGWTKDGAAYNPASDEVISSSMTLVATFAK